MYVHYSHLRKGNFPICIGLFTFGQQEIYDLNGGVYTTRIRPNIFFEVQDEPFPGDYKYYWF